MLQRLMKTLAVFTASCLLFSACKKHTYSPDEPLGETFSSSVYIGSQNQIFYALDPKTGDHKWEVKLYSNIRATPLVVGEKIYVPTETSSIYTIDAKRGKIIDTLDFAAGFISSPASDGNSVYVASVAGKVYAVSYNSKTPRWEYEPSAGASIQSSLTVYNGMVIFATTDNKVFAVNTTNGTLAWTNDLGTTANNMISSPLVSPPYIYIGSPDGKMYALDVATGVTRWSYTAEGQVLTSPINYGGNVIFSSNDNKIYCIDTAAKQPRWIYKTQDRIISSAAAYAQVVYVGGYDSYIYAVNIIDGTLKWRYKMGALIQSTPLAHDGSVYVASFDKHMYTFDTSGVLKWKYNINGPVQSSPVYWDLSKAYYPSISGMAQY